MAVKTLSDLLHGFEERALHLEGDDRSEHLGMEPKGNAETSRGNVKAGKLGTAFVA